MKKAFYDISMPIDNKSFDITLPLQQCHESMNNKATTTLTSVTAGSKHHGLWTKLSISNPMALFFNFLLKPNPVTYYNGYFH